MTCWTGVNVDDEGLMICQLLSSLRDVSHIPHAVLSTPTAAALDDMSASSFARHSERTAWSTKHGTFVRRSFGL